ncbi:accessory Sec system protein Asp3 [Paenibacillus sp. MMO-58]|uniref:accessory Sec system protein Asp3 n=1 Tax=Paenibacillus sp. MMO-58 TaxID=3081290 RepID=UPI003016886B
MNQWQTKYVKFTGRSVLRVFVGNAANNDLDFLIDGARVYEVDVTTYNKIGVDPEYTGDKLADKFPYVDSVKHLQGAAVRKVGKNLLPSFTEGGWTFHANAAITEPYKLTLNSTGDYQASFIRVPALPSTQYILNVVTTATAGAVYPRINFYDSNGTQIGNIQNGNYSNRTFTTPAGTVSIEIVLSNTGVGTFTFTNMQLELGSVATPFQPYNADYFNVPAILASNLDGTIRDSAYVRDGQLVKLKRWVTGMQLDGLLSWGWNGDMTGYKRVAFPLTGISASNTSVPAIVNLQAPNGQLFKPLSWLNRGTEANSVSVDNNTSASVLLSVNDSDTGWGESYTPSTSEIKAYFYGYKMNNGTFGTPYDGTGTKTWTLWNATNNTGAVTTVPSTLAAGFTPYSLDYVLATSVEEVISGDVGSIALAPGGNQIELLEGVVVREKITPAYSTLYKTYEINTNNSVTGGVGKAPLKNTASQIIGAYRDRVKDNWKIVSDSWANGKQRASIDEVNYDPTADYFVTYILLDKYLYTANATDAKVEYQTTLGGTVAQNTQDIADVRTRNGIQDFGLDYIEAKADNLRIDYDGHAAKTTSVHGSTSAATANAIVQRDAAGQANFSTPTANSHAATKGYLDPLSYYVNVSDNVLLSLPTERGGSAMELKVIKLKYGGRYRIKAEVRSPTAGNSAQVSGRIGITLSDAVQSNPELSLGTSSATYVAVSIDTPYLPENSVIQLYNTLTPYGYIRNVTVCGDLVVGNPNTLSGVD